MSKKQETVMEKLIADCTRAHQARVPLIMVDTEEMELMDRLARECKLVDFFSTAINPDGRYKPYYTYMGESPQPLDAFDNFTYSPQKLAELIARNDSMEYEGGSLAPKTTAPGKAPLPVMAVFHISHTSWRQGSAGTLAGSADQTLINFLRSYVQAYIRCRDLSSVLRSCRVFLYGDPSLLPQDLEPYTQILTADYPQIWELEQIIRRVAEENNRPVTSGNAPQQLAELMTGFSLIRAERFVQKLYWTDSAPGESPLNIDKYYPMLMEEKAMAVRSAGGLLELYHEKNPPKSGGSGPKSTDRKNSLGGMAAYKIWVDSRREQMHNYADYASRRGVPALKGVLLCGVPGCGKSMAAKILHQDWGISMLRMDIDKLMGNLVGDSERNMRKALELAEAMSPVILWIDEIEKGMSGASSSSNDGGTFKRMFGRLLTWMQENTKPCFIFATANDISQLPPEFFRSGRFDALFSVYMPTHAECKEIFAAQMRSADKRRRDQCKAKGGNPDSLHPLFTEGIHGCYTDDCLENIMDLVMKSPQGVRFLSGADICKIVTTALTKFPEEVLDKPISAAAWRKALKEVIDDPSLSTQGSSSSNLDEIAACYVRLMRKNFTPVSDEKQLLFRKKHYTCTVHEDKVEAKYAIDEPDKDWPPYDKALFLALKPRIQNIASLVETNALRRTSM